jgi:hypothetical protein
MSATGAEYMLIANSDPILSEDLARDLWAGNHEVVRVDTSEQGFLIAGHRPHLNGWLYCHADLPGLVDGWILADQDRSVHPSRPGEIFVRNARSSTRCHIVLREPATATVLKTMRHVIDGVRPAQDAAHPNLSEHRRAG